jgi:hypothetical protein
LIGVESEDVPGREPHRMYLRSIFNVLIKRLDEVVADLDRDAAGHAAGRSRRRRSVENPASRLQQP